YVVRELLDELGGDDADRIIATLVNAFCKGVFPEASPDGKAAIGALVSLQATEANDKRAQVEAVREERARHEREAERCREREGAAKAAKRESFHDQFMGLCGQTDAQAR